jgi:hypothetical protein
VMSCHEPVDYGRQGRGPAGGTSSIVPEVHMKYEKPVVQRFGTLRELTLGGGPISGGDATNLYHRS